MASFVDFCFSPVVRFRMQVSRSWPMRNIRWLSPKLQISTSTKQQRCGDRSSIRKGQNKIHFFFLSLVLKISQLSVLFKAGQIRVNILTAARLRPARKSFYLVCCVSTFHQHFCTELKIDLLPQQMFLCLLCCCHVMKWLEIQTQCVEKRWQIIMVMKQCCGIYIEFFFCDNPFALFWVVEVQDDSNVQTLTPCFYGYCIWLELWSRFVSVNVFLLHGTCFFCLQPCFEELVHFMSSGPSHILILSQAEDSANVVPAWREFIGPPDMEEAKREMPERLVTRDGICATPS